MKEPRVSVVIPHWRVIGREEELDGYLERCTKSLVADEVIIVVNDGIGMGKAINIGLKVAHADYIVVSNNDVELVHGSLMDMCDKNGVTYCANNIIGSFYCMPRWVYEQVGGYDERFERGYFEDFDLLHRWRVADIPIIPVSVQIKHDAGTTLDRMPDREEIFNANRIKFIEKWGFSPNEWGRSHDDEEQKAGY